ncbi:MAG: phosphoesterase [Planctomycetes bacterium]|nr:phosphoesterase [Planctomycetota bacterium]
MSLVVEEQILVVPTALFHDLGYFQGFSADVDRYLPRLLEGDQVEYRPRGEMEEDPSFKQLIPYMLFRWTDDDGTTHLFEYLRGSGQGERRLHTKRSVGIGGHISTLDAKVALSLRETDHLAERDDYTVYREGMRRELEEEVAIETPYTEKIAGLINDDDTPVGRVHLGVVHLCDVERPSIRPREADILDGQFRPVREILPRLGEFESWSEIAVRALFG